MLLGGDGAGSGILLHQLLNTVVPTVGALILHHHLTALRLRCLLIIWARGDGLMNFDDELFGDLQILHQHVDAVPFIELFETLDVHFRVFEDWRKGAELAR